MTDFWKVQASGNDFVLIDCRDKKWTKTKYENFTKKICDRKFGIGGDGILVVEESKKADFKMRIFNADGSEAEMCGNGSRCFAFWVVKYVLKEDVADITFETIAGTISASVKMSKNGQACDVKIGLSDPTGLAIDTKLKVLDHNMKISFVNTGVPHAVVEVKDIEKIDIKEMGAAIRYHDYFAPAGTNVNFIQRIKDNKILVRTYERGVEDETLSCGTGTCASAIIAALTGEKEKSVYKVNVTSRSQEHLKVEFTKEGTKLCKVFLDGKAYEVFHGSVGA